MADIFFKSAEHRRRFLAAMQQLGRIYNGKLDQEYSACLYILTSDGALWQNAQPYVDHEGVDIAAMLTEVDFSSGYVRLIKLAGNLFNSGQHIEPIDFCAAQLDDSNFQVAMTALQLRRRSLPLEMIE